MVGVYFFLSGGRIRPADNGICRLLRPLLYLLPYLLACLLYGLTCLLHGLAGLLHGFRSLLAGFACGIHCLTCRVHYLRRGSEDIPYVLLGRVDAVHVRAA